MELYGKQWPRDFHKRFFIGMHMPDRDQHGGLGPLMGRFDPNNMVARLADTGCDTLYVYMVGGMGNAYYPSKDPGARAFSYMHGRDFFGDILGACTRHGMAMVAVYEFVNLPFMRCDDKCPPDWKHTRPGADGKPTSMMCWNGGYGDLVLEQIKEVAAEYAVAGFYIDMLDYPGRPLCRHCEERFRAEFGKEPPGPDAAYAEPVFKEYRMWTFREQARYLRKVQAAVQERRPGATVVNNYHHLICEDLYRVREAVSYVTTDPSLGYASPFNDPFSRPTKTPLVFRSLSEGKPCPFDILYDPIVLDMLEVIPPEPYRAVAANAMAHGGWPCLSSMWTADGTLNPAALGLAGEVYAHVDKAAPWVGGGIFLKSTGVYLSQESEFMYANPGDKKDKPVTDYMTGFYGALMALQGAHVPVDVLTRRQLGRLRAYEAVYVPNGVCLSDMECNALRRYVHEGGTLVATYRTSLCNEWGYCRNNFELADVLGVDFEWGKIDPEKALQVHMHDPKALPLAPWENPSMTVHQPALRVKLRPGARELATLHERYGPSDRPGEVPAMPNALVKASSAGPAVVENRFGKGRCLYFAPRIFTAFAHKTVPELGKLTTRWLLSKEIAGSPARLVDAPACIRLSGLERPGEGRWILHLVNLQANPGDQHSQNGIPIPSRILPVHDVILALNPGPRSVKHITCPLSGQSLDIEDVNTRPLRVLIPRIHVHEVVCIEFEATWGNASAPVTDHDPLSMKRCTMDAKPCKQDP